MNDRYLLKSFYLAFVPVMFLSGLPPAAFAQSTSVLEEVIVTAQRCEQNLQNVPVAVSAFSVEQMEKRQLTEIPDVMDKVMRRPGEEFAFRGRLDYGQYDRISPGTFIG